MPITPEQIFQIYETYLIGICLSAGGLGAAAWLGHTLWKRSQEGPPQTHLVAHSLDEAERIAASQLGGRANIVDTRDNPMTGNPDRAYLAPADGIRPRLPE